MKMISFEEAEKLDKLDNEKVFPVKNFREVPFLLGLRSIDPPYWYDLLHIKSCLEIVDEKKWLIAKIKYGI
jgi:hypothetical protein